MTLRAKLDQVAELDEKLLDAADNKEDFNYEEEIDEADVFRQELQLGISRAEPLISQYIKP